MLTGHRFLFGTICVGGSALILGADEVRLAYCMELASLREEAAGGLRQPLFNASFRDRSLDIGVVNTADAERLGATGLAARASGSRSMWRGREFGGPLTAYSSPPFSSRAAGDVQARASSTTWALELTQSFGCAGAPA